MHHETYKPGTMKTTLLLLTTTTITFLSCSRDDQHPESDNCGCKEYLAKDYSGTDGTNQDNYEPRHVLLQSCGNYVKAGTDPDGTLKNGSWKKYNQASIEEGCRK